MSRYAREGSDVSATWAISRFVVSASDGARGDLQLFAEVVHRERLRDRVDRDPGELGAERLHPPRERDAREDAFERVVGRARSPGSAGCRGCR